MDDTTLNRNGFGNSHGAPRNEPLYPSGKGAGRKLAPPSAGAETAQPPELQAAPPPDSEPGETTAAQQPGQGADQHDSLLGRLSAQDEARPGFPGEHWLALGLGVALLVYAARRSSGSPLLRSLATTAGTGLIARAASGRDGLRSLANT